MVLSFLRVLDAGLKSRFSDVVFSRHDSIAYVLDSGDVEKVGITFSIHGAGIKPHQETWVFNCGGL